MSQWIVLNNYFTQFFIPALSLAFKMNGRSGPQFDLLLKVRRNRFYFVNSVSITTPGRHRHIHCWRLTNQNNATHWGLWRCDVTWLTTGGFQSIYGYRSYRTLRVPSPSLVRGRERWAWSSHWRMTSLRFMRQERVTASVIHGDHVYYMTRWSLHRAWYQTALKSF